MCLGDGLFLLLTVLSNWCATSWLDLHQLGLEDEGGIRGDDPTSPLGAIGQVRGDGQLTLLANAHAVDALVPARDHHACAKGELQGH